MRRHIVILGLVLSGCGGASEPAPVAEAPSAETEAASPDLAAFDECIAGIEAVATLGASAHVELVAEACAGACDGFRELAVAPPGAHELILAERCGYACPQGARLAAMAAPGERAAALVQGCGADHYGLPAGKAAFLSPSWFVLHRVVGWLAATAPGLDAERRRQLGAARLDVDLPLPPLPGLPASDAIGGPRPAALLWLRADAASRSPAPRAQLRGTELSLEGGFEVAPDASLGGVAAVAADADLLVATLHERLGREGEPFSLIVRSTTSGVGVHRVRLTSRNGDDGLRLSYGPAATVADLVRALDAVPPGGDAAIALEAGVVGGQEVALLRPGVRGGVLGGSGRSDHGPGRRVGIGGISGGSIGLRSGGDSGNGGGFRGGIGGISGGSVGGGSIGGVVGSGRGLANQRGGRARLAELSVSGTLERELVRRILRRRWTVQRYCYEKALAATPGLRGALDVGFAISTEGRITELVVEAKPASLDEVARCSRRALEATAFPSAATSTKVSFRIALAPE